MNEPVRPAGLDAGAPVDAGTQAANLASVRSIPYMLIFELTAGNRRYTPARSAVRCHYKRSFP